MYHISPKNWNKIITSIIIFFTFLFFIQAIITFFSIRHSTLSEIREKNSWLIDRINNELIYKNGIWDTAKYNSDPFTPHPDGVGGFTQPLYIITREGFVLERNMPVNGFLDSSSLEDILKYQTPQTFISPTNEEWRVISKPIIHEGETIGAILVSRYNPTHNISAEVDKDLNANMAILSKAISIKNNTIDVSKVSINNVRYNVTFEVVDKFNKVLINNGRTPSYIDTSYVENQFDVPYENYITDKLNKNQFIVFSKNIYNSQNEPIAVIVLAESIKNLYQLLKSFIIATLTTYVTIVLPLSFIAFYFLKRLITTTQSYEPKAITFDTDKQIIVIDHRTISLPKNSYQYQLSEILFINPKKVWSQENLMRHFLIENWRIIYDTAIAINKKCNIKLIIYENKSYFINPDYISYIKK